MRKLTLLFFVGAMNIAFSYADDKSETEVIDSFLTFDNHNTISENDNDQDLNFEEWDDLCSELIVEHQSSKEKICKQDSKKKYTKCCRTLPLPNECGVIFLEAEYLYWKTYNVIPYAQFRELSPPFEFVGGDVYVGEVKTVNMNADSGYRLTLGAYISKCVFGNVQYRYYRADGKSSFSDPALTTFSDLSSSFDAPWDIFGLMTSSDDGAFSVAARQRYREKVLDFNIYRAFFCDRWSLTPYMGLRFAWLKSDLTINYTRFTSSDMEDVNRVNHVDLSKHMNLGAGLQAGLNTNINLCWGFGLYTTSSFSILVGRFNRIVKNRMFDDQPIRATVSESYKVTDFQTNFQLGLGLNWGTYYCKCKYYFSLKAGYEMNVWPSFFDNFNMRLDSENPATNFNYYTKSLLTHGLNIGLRFDF